MPPLTPLPSPLTPSCQGDAEIVINQVLYRNSSFRQARGASGLMRGRTSNASLFVKATQMLSQFDEYEMMAVARWDYRSIGSMLSCFHVFFGGGGIWG